MKEKINIEKLFKQKFENFEGEVDPSVWSSIQQGIQAGAGSAGLSGFAKVAIVTAITVVTASSIWYFSSEPKEKEFVENNHPEQIISEPIIEESKKETVENTDNALVITENEEAQKEEDSHGAQEVTTEENNDTRIPENEEEVFNSDSQRIQEKEENPSENIVETQNSKDKEETEKTPVYQPQELKSKMGLQVNGNELTFNSNAENHSRVEWDFGDGSQKTFESGIHKYEKAGTYLVSMTVHGTGEKGAGQLNSETKEITIKEASQISKIPNVFTPNGDGDNDVWFIESKNLSSFSIMIQDQKGNKVFQSENPNFEWNGEKPDGFIEKGKYAYYISALGEDGETYKKAGILTIE
ncbi:MAG: gliding motility-associated C-terminal domain-containing protein [Crocinitomicaceae bacterium]